MSGPPGEDESVFDGESCDIAFTLGVADMGSLVDEIDEQELRAIFQRYDTAHTGQMEILDLNTYLASASILNPKNAKVVLAVHACLMSQIDSSRNLHTQHQAVMDSVLTADMEAVTFNEFSFLVTELRKLKDETSNRSSASNYRNAYVCLQLHIGKGPPCSIFPLYSS